jgi:hypothetical protein
MHPSHITPLPSDASRPRMIFPLRQVSLLNPPTRPHRRRRSLPTSLNLKLTLLVL